MFAGFNLKTDKDFNEYYICGKRMYENMNISIKKELDEYVNPSGNIDGTRMQEGWFPQVDADIFISHSHNDEKIAIGFAGWLKKEFNIRSFIDSCIWGYSNELLKTIDDRYCKNLDTGLYDYKDRNYSTSHVHMMLLMALYKMIDNTECIFLLNTSNSIQTIGENIYSNLSNLNNAKTDSPWIYSELIGTNLIRKKPLKEYRKNKIDIVNESLTFADEELKLNILYDTDLSNLEDINDDILDSWKRDCIGKSKENLLDYLYLNIKPNLIKEWKIDN